MNCIWGIFPVNIYFHFNSFQTFWLLLVVSSLCIKVKCIQTGWLMTVFLNSPTKMISPPFFWHFNERIKALNPLNPFRDWTALIKTNGSSFLFFYALVMNLDINFWGMHCMFSKSDSLKNMEKLHFGGCLLNTLSSVAPVLWIFFSKTTKRRLIIVL